VFSATARADIGTEIQALLSAGQPQQALLRAQAATAANPRDPQARFMLGLVSMALGKDAEAMAIFKQLTQLYPELPDPLNNIALLHVRANALPLALEALESALRNDPSHKLARANLAEVHLMLAVQVWEKLAAEGDLSAATTQRLKAVREQLLPASR
jgi:Flp pilus assembly protein TadD